MGTFIISFIGNSFVVNTIDNQVGDGVGVWVCVLCLGWGWGAKGARQRGGGNSQAFIETSYGGVCRRLAHRRVCRSSVSRKGCKE